MVPEIGKWYEDSEKNRFEIVAIDETSDSLSIQYFNGDLGEIEIDTWHRTAYSEIAASEDWSGPFGEMERDDMGYDDTIIPEGHHPLETVDWDEPFDTLNLE